LKICILTPRLPFPELAGDVLRINNISKYLKKKGHAIILVTYYDGYNRKKYTSALEQYYDRIYYVKRNKFTSLVNSFVALLINKPIQIGYYFSFIYLSAFKKVVKLENPDLYITQLLRMVPYTNILRLHDKTIVDMADALSKTYARSNIYKGLSLKKIIYSLERRRIAKYEKSTIEAYKKCVLNTQADKYFLGNQKSLFVHPMGVQCLNETVDEYNVNKIVFAGNMRTLQNQDAVQLFASDIFPIIKKSIFHAVFYIIGAEPPIYIQELADNKNIFVSGYVDSIENEIKDAAVAVAPVRIAAGIQNKILISMACGIPVVLTPLISAGVPELISQKNCIIADTSQEFANSVVALMQNKDLRNSIGIAGYDLVNTEYSWEKQLNGYEEVFFIERNK
jgi:glycosyltransferase involved in cell wall biosynthesis